jgi:hypothetical protein
MKNLLERLPELILNSERQLMRFFYAARHVERRPATDTKRERDGLWPREKLMKASSQIRNLLERETSGRVSLNSFIGRYLHLLSSLLTCRKL